jgi:hypothetical protein
MILPWTRILRLFRPRHGPEAVRARMRLRLFVVDWVPARATEYKPVSGMEEDWVALAPVSHGSACADVFVYPEVGGSPLNRRAFFQRAALATVALAVDPERLLWTPGAKRIFIPKPSPPATLEEIFARHGIACETPVIVEVHFARGL